eukprot:7622460-Pyramimonas_sp.AAC.2
MLNCYDVVVARQAVRTRWHERNAQAEALLARVAAKLDGLDASLDQRQAARGQTSGGCRRRDVAAPFVVRVRREL